jgi:3-(3-hydroxy-phenyl)propionate hydroxylase
MQNPGRVLVVGAGPVGLVASLRLARGGVPVLLIDKSPRLQDDLRASTFHPPTLEMLDELGLTKGLLDAGLRTDRWQIRVHETHERAEFDLSILADDTPYPFRLQAEQRVLCALAAAQCAREPLLELRLGHQLVSLTQSDAGVTVRVRDGDGDEYAVATPWLVAADGSSSRVRRELALSFGGLTYPETTILVTTHFPFEAHLPGLSNVNYVWYRHGTFSLLRLPDIWRCSLYAAPDETVEQALHPDNIEAKLQNIVSKESPYDIVEVRPYRIHQRILEDYRVGRVLFAGDAAHVNSPSGGMGMNGGIHDAFNLTEKLIDVWHGRSPATRLDQYTRQRRPVAEEQILRQSHANRTRMQERDPQIRAAELRRLQAMAADPVAAREHLLRSSMITGLRQSESIQ